MKKILVIAKGIEQVNFFMRMQESAEKLGYTIVYVTAHFATYRKLLKEHLIVYLIKKQRSIKIQLSDKEIINSFEYKARYFSKKLVQDLYNSSYLIIDKIIGSKDIEYIFMWNGCQIIDKAATDIARKNSIKTLYFEIANIPGKIFVDEKGTNANSSLYNDNTVLKNLDVRMSEYQIWREEYLTEKLNKHIVNQARNKYNNKNEFCINRLGDFFVTGFFSFTNLFYKFKEYLSYKSIHFNYDNYDYENKKYVFFPLQVSNDTQILMHSDIGLKDALEIAEIEAKKRNCDLLIKPHPAERNSEFVKMLLRKKEENKFWFVNYNTFKLIKNSELVITINSTVGLEAKIVGKEVKILGKALYNKFDDLMIAAYIQKYLIDIDYFSDKKISVRELENII